jgi:peptidyl-prolyl cis-trans isomerase SurA
MPAGVAGGGALKDNLQPGAGREAMQSLRGKLRVCLLAGAVLWTAAGSARAQSETIMAVVNGDVISRTDVANREKLFALSTGIPITQDVLDRLTPQVLQQLIDERLRLQEEERQKIIVPDRDIAAAIQSIEARNNLPPGVLRQRLAGEGVAMRTLVDQIRVQIGWTRVLRDVLGTRAQISTADITDRLRQIKARTGQPEYHVGEIFIPINEPGAAAQAENFANTVIDRLRAGAPFQVVAAQFSQSERALSGGDLGWVEPAQLDPEVAEIVRQMPEGAVSNPIHVAGGLVIVTLRGKREVGRDLATLIRLRQVFMPFTKPLDPANPDAQQKAALERAREISASVKSCDAMEAANKAAGAARPADPGDLRLESVNNPPLRKLLTELPVDKASQPLVASDGIAVVIICSRDEKNVAEMSTDDVREQILEERADLASRQLLGDLRRKAVIELRSS